MILLRESKIVLEVDVNPEEPEKIEFELDDDGNMVDNKEDKKSDQDDTEEESEEKQEPEKEEEPVETVEEPEEDLENELPDEGEQSDDIDAEDPSYDSEDQDETAINKQNKLINKERELFSELTDKQLSIRDKELRGNYLRVYNTCNDIIENIKLIPKTSNNISVLSFVNDKLEELKDFVTDYISNTYHTKTYLENEENYHYYIVILNKIDKLFKDLSPKKQLSGKYTK